jgi:hypothetical protein
MTFEELFVKGIKNSFLLFFLVLISFGLDMILAFPIKWCWNYVMPYLFNLPVIGWLHAFCLLAVLTSLWKITLVPSVK